MRIAPRHALPAFLLAFLLAAATLAQPGLAPAQEDAAPPAGAQQPAAPQDTQPEAVPDAAEPSGPAQATQPDGHAQKPLVPENGAPPILTDLEQLPFPARRMRELLIEAAQSGDIEKLRPYIGQGDGATLLSFGGVDGDPIDFLKSISGDEEGYEILAILQEVLEADFVRIDEGTENDMFVWPYFFALPLETLTPAQRVDLYRLVTHGDFEDMKGFGAYNFYRVGITPQGRWQFFVAGD